jgi:hypothetical protein
MRNIQKIITRQTWRKPPPRSDNERSRHYHVKQAEPPEAVTLSY